MSRRPTLLRLGWVVLLLCGCWGKTPLPPSDSSRPPPTVREPWAGKPTAEWPQILLTNAAAFTANRSLHGASAFLIRDERGVFAVTARHLLGSAGGVTPTIPVQGLKDALRSWKLHPRTLPEKSVEI